MSTDHTIPLSTTPYFPHPSILTPESDHPKRLPRFIHPVVHDGGVDSDARTQQRGGRVEREVGGDVQNETGRISNRALDECTLENGSER